MSRYNRTCILCGKNYRFCNDCSDYEHIEPWHNIYCSENCRTIFETCVDFVQKHMGKDEAREKILSCDLSNIKDFKPSFIEAINEILDKTDPVVEQPKVEEEPKPEEKPKFEQPKKFNNKRKK